MEENYVVCDCMQVSYADILDALEAHERFDSVIAAFEEIQKQTQCSTGCGGCHQKVLDIISEIMMGR